MKRNRGDTSIRVRDSEALPLGWTMKPAGEIADIKLGKMLDRQKHTSGRPLPYLRNINVRWAEFDTSDLREMFFDDDEIERYSVRRGDLVVCEGGEPGRAAIWQDTKPVMFQKALHRARPKADVTSQWLLLCLRRYASSGELMRFVSGTTIKHFTCEAFSRLPIPLPPLPEQRRIVARLEALEARSRRAREKLAAVPAQLAQARQSFFAAAFQSAVNSETAEVLPLESMTQPERTICYGVVQLGEETPQGVPCLRTSDLKPLALHTGSPKRIHESVSSNYPRTILRGGEVLVSVRGTLGGVAVAPSSVRGWNISREVAMVALRDVALSQFVATMIAAPQSQSWLTSAIKGVAYSGINIADLKHLPIPLPPLPEQHEIVRRLNAAFAKLDATARAHASAVAALDRLDQSLLARAFSGRLSTTD